MNLAHDIDIHAQPAEQGAANKNSPILPTVAFDDGAFLLTMGDPVMLAPIKRAFAPLRYADAAMKNASAANDDMAGQWRPA